MLLSEHFSGYTAMVKARLRDSKMTLIARVTFAACLGFGALMPGLAETAYAQQPVSSSSSDKDQERGMNVRMYAGDKVVMLHLDDSETARDFVSLLPVELTLEDYAATEKISMLPRKLNVTGAPAGVTPIEGDIAYYAPWGNLAIFHKGFKYSPGLIRLGRVESGIEVIRQPGTVAVRFEVAND
nr:cyclophilin-like fold protein [Pseudomonas syringae]